MVDPVPATYYGPDAAKPHEARVQWRSATSLEVRLSDREEVWDLRAPGSSWEMSAGALRINAGEPRAAVLIRDGAAISAWSAHLKAQRIPKNKEGRVPWFLPLPMSLPLGFIALCVAVYFWVLPWAAERVAMAMPPETDVRVGDAMFDGMRGDLVIDEGRSGTLQRFGEELALAPDFQLRYHVAVDDQVNAFALPGGHIVVFTGLLERMTKPGELAALLAHEATHVQKRHSMRGLARDLSGGLFLSFIIGDGGWLGLASSKSDELLGLKYSRSLETEADTIGMRRLWENGVDPQGMVDLLHLLEAEAADMPEGTSFLSSHPLTKDRIRVAGEHVRELGPLSRKIPAASDTLFSVLQRNTGQAVRIPSSFN